MSSRVVLEPNKPKQHTAKQRQLTPLQPHVRSDLESRPPARPRAKRGKYKTRRRRDEEAAAQAEMPLVGETGIAALGASGVRALPPTISAMIAGPSQIPSLRPLTVSVSRRPPPSKRGRDMGSDDSDEDASDDDDSDADMSGEDSHRRHHRTGGGRRSSGHRRSATHSDGSDSGIAHSTPACVVALLLPLCSRCTPCSPFRPRWWTWALEAAPLPANLCRALHALGSAYRQPDNLEQRASRRLAASHSQR